MTAVRSKARSLACRRGHLRSEHSKTYPSGATLCLQCKSDREAGLTSGRAEITHCGRGHEFTPENTYVNPRTGVRGCRTCRSSLSRATQELKPVGADNRTRAQWLWFKYKITETEYDELLQKQNGVCATCGEPEVIEGRPLRVDHDHDTGRVRGLLCHHCNVALGHVKDNPKTLLAMVDYLEGVH